MAEIRRMTPEEKAEANRLRADGTTIREIAVRMGWNPTTIRNATDKEAKQRNRAAQSAYRKASSLGHETGNISFARVKEDAALRMAEIPRDTRDFTARMCGDPLPGRSALDMRGRQ